MMKGARRRGRRGLWVLTALVVFTLPCVQVAAQQEAGAAITDIVVHAPSALIQTARDAVSVRRGTALDIADIQRTIQNIYALGRVSDVRVSTESFNGGVRVRFDVLPAPQISALQFEGDLAVRRNTLRSALSAGLGDRLTRSLIEEQAARVQTALSDRGYLAAVVEPELILLDNEVDGVLVFHVRAGEATRLERLDFVGDLGLPEPAIRAAFGMQEGGVFRYDRLGESIDGLRQALADAYFFHAEINIAEQASNQTENTADLVVRVEAGPRVDLQFRGWNRSDEELRQMLPFFESASIADWILIQARGDVIAELQAQGYWKPLVTFGRVRDDEGRNVEVRFTVAPVQQADVQEVAIDGNVAFSDEVLLPMLRTRKRGTLRGSRFITRAWEQDQRAITAWYRSNGFLQARIASSSVTFDEALGGVSATMTVDEGMRTTIDQLTLKVEGNIEDYGIDDSGWIAELSSRGGGSFDPEATRRDETRLRILLSDQGFLRAQVVAVVDETEDPYVVNTSFTVYPGRRSRVGQVLISGNYGVRDDVIRRELTLVPGSPLTQESIILSQSRLYKLGLFSRVDIDTARPDSIDTDPTVVVRVTEGSSLRLSWGVGYSTEEQFRGSFVVGQDNLWERNHRATGSVRASFDEQRVRFIYTDPYLFGRAIEASLVGYYESINEVGFTVQSVGTSLQLVKRHTDWLSSVWRYAFRDQQVYNLLIDEDELEPEDTAAVIGSVIYSLLADLRPNPIDPRGGSYQAIDTEWAAMALGSQSDYVRLFGRSYWYWEVPGDAVLVVAGRAGLATPYGGSVVPLPERFFAGGSTTLRGLGRNLAGPKDQNGNPLGGNVLLIGNLEYRFPLFGDLGAVIFTDIGNVFANPGTVSLDNVRETLGLGVRYSTPIGPLRLDWGRLLDPRPGEPTSRFHFAIGQAF